MKSKDDVFDRFVESIIDTEWEAALSRLANLEGYTIITRNGWGDLKVNCARCGTPGFENVPSCRACGMTNYQLVKECPNCRKEIPAAKTSCDCRSNLSSIKKFPLLN
jgi:hypothetical protein